MTSLSLPTYVPWTQVLSVLGVPAESGALPARAQCPLCRKRRLTIYQDTIGGGAWHYCFDCQQAGDMIELAAATWGVSPAVAIKRLLESNESREVVVDPDIVNKYIVALPQNRNRLRDFWRRSCEYIVTANSAEITALRNKFRLGWHYGPDRWNIGPNRLLGAHHRKGVEGLFNPYIEKHGCRISSKRQVLPGPKWREVLVIAYHDLPDRISGFLFVGREGRTEDRIFRCPNYSKDMNRPRLEAGLSNWWTVEASRGVYDGYVVAVEDAMLAVRLQLRHFAVSNVPLPLVSFFDGPRALTTASAWQNLGTRKPIIWGLKLTPMMLHQAIISNGLISIVPVNDHRQKTLDHYVRDNTPLDLLRKAIKRARPWRDALRDWASDIPDGLVEELLTAMETYRGDVEQIAEVNPRLKRLMGIPERTLTVKLNRFTLIERNHEWFSVDAKGRETKVMNGTLKIFRTKLVDTYDCDGVLNKRGVVHYDGVLTFKGREVPFCRPVSIMQHYGANNLQDALAKAIPGAVLVIAPGWQSRLTQAALQLHPPEYS